MKNPNFHYLGLTPYQATWQLQKELRAKLIEGEGEEVVLFCEHEPVITLGKSTKASDLLTPQALLKEQGIALEHVERGGSLTYHGPGQLVIYPILNLKNYKPDVHWYIRTLEELVIQTLSRYGIPSQRLCGKTGVWVEEQEISTAREEQSLLKIASIGVHISRWCCMHGIGLNVREISRAGFQHMNPCGLLDTQVTSMQDCLSAKKNCQDGSLEVREVAEVMKDLFLDLLKSNCADSSGKKECAY